MSLFYPAKISIATAERRMRKAIQIAFFDGSTDGEHHKQWVIDQMLRALLGAVDYERWRKEMDEWSEGIAP